MKAIGKTIGPDCILSAGMMNFTEPANRKRAAARL
jgi:hypothetical protein